MADNSPKRALRIGIDLGGSKISAIETIGNLYKYICSPRRRLPTAIFWHPVAGGQGAAGGESLINRGSLYKAP